MYNMYGIPGASVELGWDIGLPLLLMVVLLALAVPVWVSLGFGAIALLMATGVLPLTLFGEALFSGIDSFALIAIPLFILTGDVLVRSGLSNKLLDVAEATMGSLRSGLGTSTVLGCGFFSCISGSDAAGAAAVGRITVKRLTDSGYPLPYACALVASGSCTGILIPPSIAYIIIGLVLGISASTLFLAAAVPGVMIMVSIMITNIVINRRRGYEHSRARFSFRRWLMAVWEGKYALMIPFIILGGIYSGIFTPTEAAAVAVVTTITIGMLQGTLTLADFPKMLESSAKVNGVIVPIIAFALPLAQVLSALEVPQTFVQDITALTDNPTLITLMMLGVFILAGCVMETTPNIVILSPIMLPLAQEIGMNEIQFCIFMVTSLGVGFITPPLGLNLFVLSGLTGQSVLAIARRAIPYVLAMLVVVLMLAFIPELSLWAIPENLR
jgi:C4-dicarboxylate transporter DctM subunit